MLAALAETAQSRRALIHLVPLFEEDERAVKDAGFNPHIE